MSEELAQGPFSWRVAKVGFEPVTLETEGTEPHHNAVGDFFSQARPVNKAC